MPALRRADAAARRLARTPPVRHLAERVLALSPAPQASPPPAPAPAGPPPYGSLWVPADEEEARKLILETTDSGEFEASGREEADAMDHLVGPCSVVLDFGCGSGRVARYVAPRCASLVAVDASTAMLELARSRLAGIPNLRFVLSRDSTIPDVADASVDHVYSILVLQHLEREDAFLVLRELWRVLRPGGSALLTFPNLLSETYLAAFVNQVGRGGAVDRQRARYYTPQEVTRVLPAAGLDVVSLQEEENIRVTCRRRSAPGS